MGRKLLWVEIQRGWAIGLKTFLFLVECGRTEEWLYRFEGKHNKRRKIERMHRMYVVCKEHVELAIENFVDEYEDAPDIVDLKETEFSDWDPPVKCAECEKHAEFLIV